MRLIIIMLMAMATGFSPLVKAAEAPAEVATIFVRGFDPAGANTTGPVGEDIDLDYAGNAAVTFGFPYGLTDPTAPNQIAATEYYGDTYPSYYTVQDIAEVNALTTQFGGGVPRYAAIVAKFARQVMVRSGAKQVNLVGASFGGLIARYIIEKDLENLASNNKIARFVGVAGVISGNYAATYGGPLASVFFDQYFGGMPVDLEHMKYTWVAANISDPRESSNSPYLSNIECHFFLAADDNIYSKTVTNMSGKSNDGVVLLEDGYLKNLPASSLYQGLLPTVSTLHATHNSLKDKPALYAGLAATLTGRRRVTVTLTSVRVLREMDGGNKGQGEYVFGVKVYSPVAQSLGVAGPIQDLRAEDNSFPYLQLPVDTLSPLSLLWFDDMILPGETQLLLETNVEEIDADYIYNINEASGEVRQPMANAQMFVSAAADGDYTIETGEWVVTVNVKVTDYPAFGTNGSTAAHDWALYQ